MNPNQPNVVQREPSNGLGVAGFIVSLVGLVATCGALCPVGLLLSGMAMFKKPRGFATAGLILGFIGTVAIGVVVVTGVAATAFAARSAHQFEQLELSAQAHAKIAALAERVGVFNQQNGRPPLALDLMPYVDAGMLNDPWGRTFELELDATGFGIRSVGPDGIGHTDDDVWQAWDFSSEGVTPRALPTQPEDQPMFDESEDVAPIAPVPPMPPVAPVAPQPPNAPGF